MSIPPKLKSKLRKCKGNQRELARQLNINAAYVNAYIKHGKEPSNPEIRTKMFLPRKPRKPRASKPARPPLPEHIKWWRTLSKEHRDLHIHRLYINEGEK